MKLFYSSADLDILYGFMVLNLFIFYYQWDLFNYFNIMNCKALWSISGVSAI